MAASQESQFTKKYGNISLIKELHQEAVNELCVEAIEVEDGVNISFNYDTSIYSKDGITKISEYYLALVNNISENIFCKISDYDFFDDADKIKHYWSARLKNSPASSIFPIRKEAIDNKFKQALHSVDISSKLFKDINKIATSCKIDIENILYAAFFILLAKHVQRQDLVVGSLSAIDIKEIDNKNSITLLPMRMDVYLNNTFHQYLKHFTHKKTADLIHKNINLDDLTSLSGTQKTH